VENYGFSRMMNFDLVKSKSARWLAPERYQSYSQPTQYSDVFSFGMLCYEILTLKVPFHGTDDSRIVSNLILNGERPNQPHNISGELWGIIDKCWAPSIQKRPNFKEIAKELSTLIHSSSVELSPYDFNRTDAKRELEGYYENSTKRRLGSTLNNGGLQKPEFRQLSNLDQAISNPQDLSPRSPLSKKNNKLLPFLPRIGQYSDLSEKLNIPIDHISKVAEDENQNDSNNKKPEVQSIPSVTEIENNQTLIRSPVNLARLTSPQSQNYSKEPIQRSSVGSHYIDRNNYQKVVNTQTPFKMISSQEFNYYIPNPAFAKKNPPIDEQYYDDMTKPFKCSFKGCNSTFTRPANLKSHFLTHQGARPFVCEVGSCQRAFVRKHDLKRHRQNLHK
jgi:hypothetical protein